MYTAKESSSGDAGKLILISINDYLSNPKLCRVIQMLNHMFCLSNSSFNLDIYCMETFRILAYRTMRLLILGFLYLILFLVTDFNNGLLSDNYAQLE